MAGKNPPSASQLIEELGFGPAQLRILVFGGAGVFFCDGVELILGNICALSISNEFQLEPSSRAFYASVALLGLMLGTLASGYLGDTVGRRHPIVWSYLCTSLLSLACARTSSYAMLLVFRALLGFSMGVGMPPASAMISECTPMRWRVLMRTLMSVSFAIGGLCVAVCIMHDDRYLKHLHWRFLLTLAAVPPAMGWITSIGLLPESPVFLSSVGKRADAVEAFRGFARLNRSLWVDVDRVGTDGGDAKGCALPLREQLAIIFSPRYLCATLVLLYASFSVNLVSYGSGYAGPQVLTVASERAPAVQTLITAFCAIPWVVVAGGLTEVISRKTAVLMGTCVATSVCVAFAVGASHSTPRPLLYMILFQYGNNVGTLGSALGMIAVYQMAAEVYPALARTTGSALVMGCGRLAAVVAPFSFEIVRQATGQWVSFYILMGAIASIAVAVVLTMPDMTPHSDSDADYLQAKSGASMMGYGTTAKMP